MGQSNSNRDRWLKQDHTQRRREEEEWRSAGEKREWVKGQVHSVSLVWLIWRGETTISACVSGPWRQRGSSALTMVCFPLCVEHGLNSLANITSVSPQNQIFTDAPNDLSVNDLKIQTQPHNADFFFFFPLQTSAVGLGSCKPSLALLWESGYCVSP